MTVGACGRWERFIEDAIRRLHGLFLDTFVALFSLLFYIA